MGITTVSVSQYWRVRWKYVFCLTLCLAHYKSCLIITMIIIIITIIGRLRVLFLKGDPTNKVPFKICILEMAVSLRIQPRSTGLVPPLGHHPDSAWRLHQQTTRQDARAWLCLRDPVSFCPRMLQALNGWPQLGQSPWRACVLDLSPTSWQGLDGTRPFPPPHPVTSGW